MTPSDPMQIGDLAAQLRINTKTIRYYESIGLMPEPERTAAGYRLYNARDFERLQFIRKAKTIGLSLEEIGQILSLRDKNHRPCERVLSVVSSKITAIDEQLRTLNDLRYDLVELRREATETVQREGSICSIIEDHKVAHT